jgi:hypothetical protein
MIHSGHVYDFEDENLSQLMSGVVYDGEYTKMDDFPLPSMVGATSADFITTLVNNSSRQGLYNTMEVIFSGAALTVKINGQQVYHDSSAGLTLGQFDLQSHWDSGVVFRDMDVTEN